MSIGCQLQGKCSEMKRRDNHAESHGQSIYLAVRTAVFQRCLQKISLVTSYLIASIWLFDLRIFDKIRKVPGLSKKALTHTHLKRTCKLGQLMCNESSRQPPVKFFSILLFQFHISVLKRTAYWQTFSRNKPFVKREM